MKSPALRVVTRGRRLSAHGSRGCYHVREAWAAPFGLEFHQARLSFDRRHPRGNFCHGSNVPTDGASDERREERGTPPRRARCDRAPGAACGASAAQKTAPLAWAGKSFAFGIVTVAAILIFRKGGVCSERVARIGIALCGAQLLLFALIGYTRKLPRRAGAVALDRFHGPRGSPLERTVVRRAARRGANAVHARRHRRRRGSRRQGRSRAGPSR